MNEALLALAVLACPVGMALMVWFMMHSRKRSSPTAPPPPPAIEAELIKLRAEADQVQPSGRDAGRPPWPRPQRTLAPGE